MRKDSLPDTLSNSWLNEKATTVQDTDSDECTRDR